MTTTRVAVEICSRTFAYPLECPCCGSEPDAELAVPFRASSRMMAEDTATRVLFPYCRRCLEHVATWEAGSMTSSLLTLFGIVGGAVIGLAEGAWPGLLVLAAAVATALLASSIIQSNARTRCMPSCACAGKAVTFYGWSGSTNTFSFESATYTARFAELNAANLVSVDAQLTRLLEGLKRARLQVPTPASATRTVPPPRTVDEWLELLRRQPVRVLRRMILERALEGVHGEERKTLAECVARLELAPLLASIDALPKTARQRELRRAISEARADNLRNELRDAQLQILRLRAES